MFENIKDPYHASLLHVFLVTFGFVPPSISNPLSKWTIPAATPCWSAERVSKRPMRNWRRCVCSRRIFSLRDPRLLDPVREFPGDATVVMMLWPVSDPRSTI